MEQVIKDVTPCAVKNRILAGCPDSNCNKKLSEEIRSDLLQQLATQVEQYRDVVAREDIHLRVQGEWLAKYVSIYKDLRGQDLTTLEEGEGLVCKKSKEEKI